MSPVRTPISWECLFTPCTAVQIVPGWRFQHSDGSTPPADDTVNSGSGEPNDSVTEGAEASAEPDPTEEQEVAVVKKHSKPLSRKEKGKLADLAGEFERELDSAPVWPSNVPLYNVAGQMGDIFLNPTTEFPNLDGVARAVREKDRQKLAELLGDHQPLLYNFLHTMDLDEQMEQRGTSEAILHWETHQVLKVGPVNEPHPKDKVAKCTVHLRDLQRVCDLSDQALQHIALICGPRYDSRTGNLTLTSRKFGDREANRRDILRMLNMLVEAGHNFTASREQHTHTEDAPQEAVG
ncbi:hypothetical protein WJX73_009337 [Symbiochloris irregularis]|uniref:Small ribosomal subunit protein mS35 mitochondrial conserved domain-containing protein n=1 Tax=Symbiochloris irregularis TaxID=706552 RepID=A0AAW1NWY2_9CHLO